MINLLRNTLTNYRYSIDPNAQAFLNAAGITGSTQVNAINNLVRDLKNYGLWSKMKAVYPFVTDNRNLLSYTEDFSNAVWAKNNSTISTNTTTDPFGSTNADTLFDNGSNAAHYVSTVNTAFGQNGNNTSSIYAKANTLGYLWMYFYNGSEPAGVSAWFNLSNGTVGTVQSGLTATIQDAGNGWYRCSISRNFNFTAANSNCGYGITSGDNVTSYVGTGKSIYIYGAQLELGSSVSTYQAITTTPQAFMASQFKYNLKDPRDLDAAFRLVFNGGWTHSSNGATPNGTNGYADTKLVPSTVINNVNDGHLSYYSRTQSTGNYVDIGTQNGTSSFDLLISYAGTLAGACINMLDSNLFSYTGATTGFFIGSQNNTANVRKYYRNSGFTQTQTVSQNEQPTTAISIGARGPANNNFYTNRQCAFATIGNGLTDTEATNFYYCVQKYQTSLGRNIGSPAYALPTVQDTNAKLFLSAINSADATINAAIDTFIQGLKTDGIYSKMKALYPFVGGTASSHKFNLINPQDDDSAFRLVFNGGWTHSANGALPNGTNGYADSKFNLSLNFNTREQSYSLYTQTSNSNANVLAGVTDGSNPTQFYNGTGQYNILSVLYAKGSSFQSGNILMSSNLNSITAFERTNKLGSTSGTTYSAVNYNYYIGARNNAGTTDFYADRRYSFAHIGNYLTDTEAANLYSRVQTLQTTLSRQV